jgi:hypothetical protein
MGATFDNLISEWQFQEGTLVLKMRSGKVDTGVLIFDNPAAEREAGSRAARKQQEQGKKRFKTDHTQHDGSGTITLIRRYSR